LVLGEHRDVPLGQAIDAKFKVIYLGALKQKKHYFSLGSNLNQDYPIRLST
jgi:hypothetical protein